MKQHPRLIEVLTRAETGPIMEEADFERNLLGPTIKKLVEKYGGDRSGGFWPECRRAGLMFVRETRPVSRSQ